MSNILRPANEDDLRSFADARDAIRQGFVPDPSFDTARNPHLRIFFANFDGTGNDVEVDHNKATNVARIREDVQALNEKGLNAIRTHYVEGPGTQAWKYQSLPDQATGNTYPNRLEAMYGALCEQTLKWKNEDPEAEIRVVSVGFSRGATEAAGFTTLVDRRGIQDPTQARIEREVEPVQSSRNWFFNSYENVRVFDGAPLVGAGDIKQAVVLFDPVATGGPQRYDRELPDSVVSGLQITAKDEHRTLFPVNEIIDRNRNGDGRFMNVQVNGAHSDIGGGYSDGQGLARLSGNLASEYLNNLTGHRIFRQEEVALDQCVVHDSNGTKFRNLARMQGLPPEVDRDGPGGVDPHTLPQGLNIRVNPEHLLHQGTHEFPRQPTQTRIPEPRLDEMPRDPERPMPARVNMPPQGPGADAQDILMQAMTAVRQLGGSERFAAILSEHKDRQALSEAERRGLIDPTGLALSPEDRDEQSMRRIARGLVDPTGGESMQMRLAGAVALECKRAGLDRIDELVLNNDGSKLVAIQRNDGHPELSHRVPVDIDVALSVPLAVTVGELREETRREQEQRQLARQPDAPGVQQGNGIIQ